MYVFHAFFFKKKPLVVTPLLLVVSVGEDSCVTHRNTYVFLDKGFSL